MWVWRNDDKLAVVKHWEYIFGVWEDDNIDTIDSGVGDFDGTNLSYLWADETWLGLTGSEFTVAELAELAELPGLICTTGFLLSFELSLDWGTLNGFDISTTSFWLKVFFGSYLSLLCWGTWFKVWLIGGCLISWSLLVALLFTFLF